VAGCCAALLHAACQLTPGAVGDVVRSIMVRAEESAGRCTDDRDRARLHTLRSKLLEGRDRKDEVERALKASDGIADPVARTKLVFPLLESLDDLTQQRAVSSLLHGLAMRGRFEVFSGLRELGDVLRRLGGSAAAAAVPATIQACVRTWPCFQSRESEAWGD